MFQVSQMFEIAFDGKTDKEKRETAMNNLLVLSREKAGAEIMFSEKIVSKIVKLLKVEKNEEIYIAAIRIIAELCKDNVTRTDAVIREVGIPWFLDIVNSRNEERVNAAQYCMQVCISEMKICKAFLNITNMKNKKPRIEF